MPSKHDLVIRQGTIIDGTGRAGFVGDIAIDGGIISAVASKIDEAGRAEIDAAGAWVTPGFVDIHTHYDGHATWAERLNPSSEHGVTTVVMGNCGVGFAPCRAADRERLIHLMEGVEDIPEAAMSAGLSWTWETFPDYLDRLDERRFDMDVATQLPHAPLRVYVMGERALTGEPATAADMEKMRALAKQAVESGALGFSTSRSLNHRASDGTLTPSYAAAADELAAIACGLGDAGKGVLQLISDFDDVDREFAIASRMVEDSGRPLSLSVLQFDHAPRRWRDVLNRIEQANAAGLAIKGQVCGRPVGVMLSFAGGRNPFTQTAAYQEIAELAPRERFAALRDPLRRERILSEFEASRHRAPLPMLLNFEGMYEFGEEPDYEPGAEESIAARARAAGQTPAALAYDVLVRDFDAIIYVPAANYAGNSTAAIEAMLASQHTILGLGDGGAHCGMICDASLPTYMLKRWSQAGSGPLRVEDIVSALTSKTAAAVGLGDRGTLARGMRADVNVIDLARVAVHRPRIFHDLPMGGARLGQGASGFLWTIVAGQPTYRDGVATGALPGRLIRGSRSRAAPATDAHSAPSETQPV